MPKINPKCKECINVGGDGYPNCAINSVYGVPTCILTRKKTVVHFNGFNCTTF